jgi:chemotaxis protein methyltransferase WspC
MISSQLYIRLKRATGIDLPQPTVEAALRRRRKERGIADPRLYEADALCNEEEFAALIDLVVVPESWFFRDPESFAAACRFARAKIDGGTRPVRMLSIPCACGEEPYSLAMALLDAGIAAAAFEIDAVDVNPRAIECAQRALYSRNAFRSRDLSFRDRYFLRSAQTYALHQEIRACVRFQRGSLLDIALPARRYDLVFCRNLLIYFDAPTQQQAIMRLDALLQDDGVLFTGYAETMPFCQRNFMLVPIARAFALRKRNGAPRVVHALPALKRSPPAPRAPLPQTVVTAPAAAAPADLLRQARLVADRGDTDAAVAAYRACLEQTPNAAEAWFMLGVLSERAQDDARARQYLRRAVYLDPGHYEALCYLALLAQRAGDDDGAARYRRRAARVYARNPKPQADR